MAETITVHAAFRKGVLKEIPIEMLHSGTYQPRDTFSEEALESLAKTIEQLGILEPLIVRASPKQNQFEIVAGERRWRAAKRAGLMVVPCLKQGHLSEGHGKLLAGIAYEKQYWYAYYAIKKEWSVSILDNAIKAGEDKKLAASRARKSAQPLSPLEKQLTEQFGFPLKVAINKNDTGYFRIPFHDLLTCRQY